MRSFITKCVKSSIFYFGLLILLIIFGLGTLEYVSNSLYKDQLYYEAYLDLFEPITPEETIEYKELEIKLGMLKDDLLSIAFYSGLLRSLLIVSPGILISLFVYDSSKKNRKEDRKFKNKPLLNVLLEADDMRKTELDLGTFVISKFYDLNDDKDDYLYALSSKKSGNYDTFELIIENIGNGVMYNLHFFVDAHFIFKGNDFWRDFVQSDGRTEKVSGNFTVDGIKDKLQIKNYLQKDKTYSLKIQYENKNDDKEYKCPPIKFRYYDINDEYSYEQDLDLETVTHIMSDDQENPKYSYKVLGADTQKETDFHYKN